MKKIFLLDDEIQVREGIQSCIDWQKEGFIYCGDAPDGEIALPLIEKVQPDIVITDIKMPFMDGLELSRILRKKYPWMKIIILSGHDEFEYARDAMRIQISEYCLKPISPTELLQTLHKVSMLIDKETKEKEILNEIENRAKKHALLTREAFLIDLCEGHYVVSDAIRKASDFGINLISRYYCVLIISSKQMITDTFKWIEEQFDCIVFNRNTKESVYIFQSNEQDELSQQISIIKEKLLSIAKVSYNSSLLFGFGKVESRIQGIALSFSFAEEEKSYYRILQNHTVKQIKIENGYKKDSLPVSRNELLNFLKYGDRTAIDDFAEDYSSFLKNGEPRSPFFVYYFLLDFTSTIKLHLKDIGVDDEDVLEEIRKIEIGAGWIRDNPDVITYIKDMLQLFCKSRDSISNEFYPIIKKAKDYINRNYHDSALSLQTVANFVNVSPSYFSHMFSQKTGQTLIEFLTEIRIESAKKLLVTTNNKTYEIALMVGYSDSHYFCNQFKKMTGMTTREYKLHYQTLQK
ncbi:response regulator transcription factor [Robertmurraya sp. Marseille-Q9965]